MGNFRDPSEMQSFYGDDWDYDYAKSDLEEKNQKEKMLYGGMIAELLEEFYGEAPLDEEKVNDLLEELRCYFELPAKAEDLTICRKER
jgi:hypothetical protein